MIRIKPYILSLYNKIRHRGENSSVLASKECMLMDENKPTENITNSEVQTENVYNTDTSETKAERAVVDNKPTDVNSDETSGNTDEHQELPEENVEIEHPEMADSHNGVRKPEISRCSYCDITNGYAIGMSIQGRSHVEDDSPCQDYHLFESLDDEWYLAVVSDGAGSAKFSGRGSKANCNLVSTLVKQLITEAHWKAKPELPTELEWYIEARAIFEKMKLFYRAKVEEFNDGSTEEDFYATVLFTIITPMGMLSAHIGDGRMGYRSKSGEWKSLMKPHKGEEANQTIFVQNNWTNPRVPSLKLRGVSVPEIRIVNEVPTAVVLMSDGCEQSAWECTILDNETNRYVEVNLPHPGFMNPLIENLNLCKSEDEKKEDFFDILDSGTKSCEKERDDKTMLLVVFKQNEL